MARFARKVSKRAANIAAAFAFVLGAAITGGAGYALVPMPVRCEPAGGEMMRMAEDRILVYSAEQCEDGSMRMVPSRSIPLMQAPSEDEGPKSEA